MSRVRRGLLGSTALVAVGLAATGAMAQTYTPTGGGTIVVTGGGVTTDNTAAGGGFQNVGGVSTTIDGVNITNTTGVPTTSAVDFTRSTFSGTGDGLFFTGTNTLVAAPGGTGLTFVSTGGNNTGVSFGGILNVTGRNGLSLSTGGTFFHGGPATINLTAETAGQGTGLSMQAAGSVGDASFTGAFNATNFQYGVDLTAGTGINFATGAGGSITGVQTGIRAVTTTGAVDLTIGSSVSASGTGISATSSGGATNVAASGAIVASGGIVATGTNGASVTTSGTGTLNSTAAGSGTGITATSSGGTGAVTVNVGAAIGDATAFATGVSASTTGSSTGAINITTTAAITATGRGISVTSGTFGNTGTINVGGDVTGADGIYTNVGNYTVNVDAGVTVTSTGNVASNAALYLVNGTNTVTNNGALVASGAGDAGLFFSNAGMSTNTATGTITGSTGVYYLNNASLTNEGTITGTGVAATDAGIRSSGGTFNNTGSIVGNNGLYNSGNTFTVNNTGGTITGATHGISMAGGFLRLTNTGTITGTVGSGVLVNVALTVANQQITNSGSIQGGSDATDGFGVNVVDGIFVLTNRAGGTISGGTGGIRLAGNDLATLNLNVGSTVNGDIVSSNTGDRTITVAGTLNGDYAGTAGTGTTAFELATGGAMQSANFGTGTTTFNWTGGTIAGGVTTTGGSYQNLNVNLGAGGTGTIGGISRFFLNANSGTVTLTGSNVTSLKLLGGNIVLDTDLNTGGSTTASFQTTAGSTLTVNAGRSLISSTTGVNLSVAGTVTNAGTITGGQMAGVNGNFYFYGVNNQAAGSVINNSGTIAVGEYNLVAAIQNSSNLQVNNTGLIRAGAVSSTLTTDGIRSYGGTLTVANSTAGSIIAGGEAGILTTSGTLILTNSGYVVGAANAINAAGTVSITNAGTIGTGQVTDAGVYTAGGTGYAISTNGGTITNSGTIHGASAGIYSSNGLNLTNTGTISGGEGNVVLFRDGVAALNAPSTILNAGTISSQTYSALLIQGGTITNAAAGSLTGGTDSTAGVAVQFSATGGTFTNYGSATGAGAGAVRVNTPGAATTINLHAGSTTGAILLNSGNDTVAIYNGRGSASGATVDGASGITLQAAGTLAAASFGAINMGTGTNTLVLAGIGDGTAANGAAGTMANGAVGGVSNLSKVDSGLWTLTGAGSYAGTTTVSGGTLRVLNTGNGLGNGAVSIASGATLNFDNQTSGLMSVKGDVFTGAGRILFTGNAGSITALGNGGNGNVQISLSQGGLIDVQSGTVNGSSSGQGIWTNNMGGLNIASGARLDTVEGLVRVDALTGAGTLSGGYGGTVPITLGVAGGSGTFSGVIRDSTEFAGRYLALTKIGAGTQTLSGTNTYTGQTTISGGTLEVRNGSAILDTGVVSVSSGATFLVSDAETIGRLTGAGAVNLANGALTLSNSSGTYSGAVSGTGSLVLSGGSLTLGGALTNSGGLVLSGTTGASLLSTGSITVAGNAVTMTGTSNSLTNAGAVSSSGGIGVTASGGLTLSNNAGGTISGQMGVYSGGVGVVTNATGASITGGSLNNTVRLAGNGSSLTNAGTISGSTNFAGVFFDGTGTVTNQAGGSISNTGSAVQFNGAGSVLDNAGTISNTNTNSAVYFDNSGTVTNRVGGAITASAGGGFGVQITGPGSSITNAGTITAGSRAVHLQGANALLSNSGTISAGNHGVVSLGTATISNDLGGTISGTVFNGVYGAGTGTTVTNAGLITGGNAAVYLVGSNSSVINTGTIRITGGSANTVVSGIFASGAGTSVTNSGLIDSSFDGGHGLSLTGGTGTITNQSGGVISGNNAAAIVLAGAGYTLDLQVGSTVNGLIDASATTGLNTVSLGGDLNGAYVGGSGADVITLLGGATFSSLFGQDGDDTLVLGGLNDGALDIGQTTGFENRTMNGDGIWTLTGVDTDAADWTLDSGTLRLTGGQSVSDGAGILVNSGATLSVGESEAIGALNGAGSVTIDADQTLFVGVNDTNSRFDGIISGAGGLSQSGTGNLTLYGANTYTGDTRVDAGMLRLGASGVIADTSRLIVLSDAALDLQGFDETVAVAYLNGTVFSSQLLLPPLVGGAGGGPEATPLPTGTGTLTAAEYQLNGATIHANLGTGALFNTGGLSLLNGTSAAEFVTVTAGTLRLGASGRLNDSAELTIQSGATFDLNGFDQTVGLAVINGTLNGFGTLNPAIGRVWDKTADDLIQTLPGLGMGTLTATEYQLYGATVNANLGTGSLFNIGGVSLLNGTSGADIVSVQAGTLQLGASNRLADTATVSVAFGTTLDLQTFNDTVAAALLNGTLAGTGTLTSDIYQLNGATIDANLGTGTLYNTGGVSVLNGTSAASYVDVYSGTLQLGAADRLADTATLVVGSGATFDLNGHDETVSLAVINGTLNGSGANNPGIGLAWDKTADDLIQTLPGLSFGTLTAAEYQLNGATINANLGTGRLFNIGGVSVLNGTSAADIVSVQVGTLRLGASDRLSDAATLSISSGAIFDLADRTDTIGALFGMGDLNVGSGRLTFGGEESAFGGRLTGTGSIVHTAGLFTLLGDHGLRTISNTGGELRFIGSTTGGVSLTGGSLTGAATIGGALTLAPGAVLSPGLADQNNGIGGFTLGGLTMNGGTLSLDVLGRSGGSLIDQIRVLGVANLTGGLVDPNFHGTATDFGFSSRYLFLSADQLIGRFANGVDFTADASLEGLYWRVRYDLAPNGAVLELRQLTNFDPGTGGTGNQGAVGRALTGGQLEAGDDWAGVLDAFSGLEGAALNAALDSVGGEALADMTTSMFSVSDNFLNAVRESAGLTTDSPQSLGYANRLEFGDLRDGRAAMVVGVMDAFDPATRSQGISGGWVTAYASDATLEGKTGQADVDTRTNGFALGYGVERDNVMIGGAIGASRVEGDVLARSSSYESDVTHAAAYVRFDDGDWAAGVTASTFGGQLASQREIAVGAYRGFAIGSTDADGGAISASVSRRFHFDDDGSIALGAMATASRSKVGSFTEDLAGGLSLEVEEQRRDWQTLQLGARGVQGYSVNGRSFRIYGGLGLLATTGDRDARADMRFSGAAAGFGGFTIEGAEMPPLAGVTDFGLEYEARDGLTLSAGYRGVVSDRLQDHQVGARLRAVW